MTHVRSSVMENYTTSSNQPVLSSRLCFFSENCSTDAAQMHQSCLVTAQKEKRKKKLLKFFPTEQKSVMSDGWMESLWKLYSLFFSSTALKFVCLLKYEMEWPEGESQVNELTRECRVQTMVTASHQPTMTAPVFLHPCVNFRGTFLHWCTSVCPICKALCWV